MFWFSPARDDDGYLACHWELNRPDGENKQKRSVGVMLIKSDGRPSVRPANRLRRRDLWHIENANEIGRSRVSKKLDHLASHRLFAGAPFPPDQFAVLHLRSSY